jgi:hypothetical protein
MQAVRSKYWIAKTTRKVRIRWLPAHIGLRGNEDADALADEAARLSAQGSGFTSDQLRHRILNRNFYGPSDAPKAPPRDPKRNRDHAAQHPAPNTSAQTPETTLPSSPPRPWDAFTTSHQPRANPTPPRKQARDRPDQASHLTWSTRSHPGP